MANEAERIADPRRSRQQGQVSDEALNFKSDEEPNINKQLRRLDMQLVLETARENLGTISSAVLLGGALGFLFKRRFTVASNLVLAFVLQQFLLRHRNGDLIGRRNGTKSKEDIELERYALKAQRGDYGKLEVIAFK